MKERTLYSPQMSEDQDDAPDGFVLWIGFDKVATKETGVLHICEFPVPEDMHETISSIVTDDTVFDLVINEEVAHSYDMLGMTTVVVFISPLLLGVR